MNTIPQSHPGYGEDDGLAARLRDEGITDPDAFKIAAARCLEMDRHRKALMLRYANYCHVTLSQDELLAMDQWEIREYDVSTVGERGVKLELVRVRT